MPRVWRAAEFWSGKGKETRLDAAPKEARAFVTGPLFFLNPAIDVLAIGIIAISVYLVSRQQNVGYPNVKKILLLVYFLFVGVMILEFLRSFLSSATFMYLYAFLGTSFILWDVCLLTIIGYCVYARPAGSRLRDLPTSITNRFPHNVVLFAFFAFIAFSDAFVAVAPGSFTVKEIPDIYGDFSPPKTVAFGSAWLLQALIILVAFIGYTTLLFVISARKTPDRSSKRALYTIPVAWVVIGGELIVFNGYFVQLGYDVIDPGYLIAAVAFAVTGYSFRGASTMAGFFGPIERQLIPLTNPFSARLRRAGEGGIRKGIYLLEADPSARFEQLVSDFATEEISNRVPVYLFSARGTVIANTLSKINGIRLCTFNDKVTFPKPGERPNEMLVPSGDQAVLLDCFSKTVSNSPKQDVAIVYDSISDLILFWGTDDTYRFMRKAVEVLSQPNVTTLFLMVAEAHDEHATNLIRSLVPNLLTAGPAGLARVKTVSSPG